MAKVDLWVVVVSILWFVVVCFVRLLGGIDIHWDTKLLGSIACVVSHL
jgi:hypothetical protein